MLLHVWRTGEGRIRAFLDDYAFLIRGLLALEEATGDERWLEAAEALTSQMEARLGDPLGGYFNSESDSALLVRSKTATDGAVPSGNGVAALGLLRLAARTGKVEYRRRAAAAVRSFSRVLTAQPAAAPSLTLASRQLLASDLAGQSVEPAGTPISSSSGAGALAREVVSLRAGLGEAAQGGEWADFWLTLSIREGWHLNANPASLESPDTDTDRRRRQGDALSGRSNAGSDVRWAPLELVLRDPDARRRARRWRDGGSSQLPGMRRSALPAGDYPGGDCRGPLSLAVAAEEQRSAGCVDFAPVRAQERLVAGVAFVRDRCRESS